MIGKGIVMENLAIGPPIRDLNIFGRYVKDRLNVLL